MYLITYVLTLDVWAHTKEEDDEDLEGLIDDTIQALPPQEPLGEPWWEQPDAPGEPQPLDGEAARLGRLRCRDG